MVATVTVFSGRSDHTLTIPSSQPRYNEIKETYANIANSFTREHAFEAGLQVFHSAISIWTEATDIWTINGGLATPVHLLLSTMPGGELLRETIREVQRDIGKLDIYRIDGIASLV